MSDHVEMRHHGIVIFSPTARTPTKAHTVDAALIDDAPTIAGAIAAIVDRVARDGGPAILPYHAWAAIGETHRGRILQRARLLGVPVAVTLPE
jgi:hypothetical protein